MPSLITEKRLIGKALKERKKQSHERYGELLAFYSIQRDLYIYIEIVFRQLVMHEKFNTAFAYKNEKPIQFPIKGYIDDLIGQYLKTDEDKETYGLFPLEFEKMNQIKNAEKAIKKRYADIGKLKSQFLRLQKSSVDISSDYVLTHLDELKDLTNKKIEDTILRSQKPSLKKFITITEKGDIEIHHKTFDFFKMYSLILYCLMEPHILKPQNKGRKETNGIYGYIASKYNFEFSEGLGFTATAKDVADKVRDNKNQIKIYKSKIKSLGLA